jgi:hypothetical protein
MKYYFGCNLKQYIDYLLHLSMWYMLLIIKIIMVICKPYLWNSILYPSGYANRGFHILHFCSQPGGYEWS